MRNQLILFFILLSGVFSGLYACDCSPTVMDSSFNRANIVAKVRIIGIREFERNISDTYQDSFQKTRDALFFKDAQIIEYKAIVLETFKALDKFDTVYIRTYRPSNCHLKLNLASEYILYAYDVKYLSANYDLDVRKNTFQSSRCSRTMVSNKQEVRALRKLKKR